jgi:hypothetical protein
VVTIFLNGTTTQFTNAVYADATSNTLLGNPFVSADGNVDFYLDTSQRVDLGIQPPGLPQVILHDIDVEVSGIASGSLGVISGSTITNSVFEGPDYQLNPSGLFLYQEGS